MKRELRDVLSQLLAALRGLDIWSLKVKEEAKIFADSLPEGRGNGILHDADAIASALEILFLDINFLQGLIDADEGKVELADLLGKVRRSTALIEDVVRDQLLDGISNLVEEMQGEWDESQGDRPETPQGLIAAFEQYHETNVCQAKLCARAEEVDLELEDFDPAEDLDLNEEIDRGLPPHTTTDPRTQKRIDKLRRRAKMAQQQSDRHEGRAVVLEDGQNLPASVRWYHQLPWPLIGIIVGLVLGVVGLFWWAPWEDKPEDENTSEEIAEDEDGNSSEERDSVAIDLSKRGDGLGDGPIPAEDAILADLEAEMTDIELKLDVSTATVSTFLTLELLAQGLHYDVALEGCRLIGESGNATSRKRQRLCLIDVERAHTRFYRDQCAGGFMTSGPQPKPCLRRAVALVEDENGVAGTIEISNVVDGNWVMVIPYRPTLTLKTVAAAN